jgi:hypothetical protein
MNCKFDQELSKRSSFGTKRTWNRNFDTGMAYFLACIKELADHAESIDGKKLLKYE